MSHPAITKNDYFSKQQILTDQSINELQTKVRKANSKIVLPSWTLKTIEKIDSYMTYKNSRK